MKLGKNGVKILAAVTAVLVVSLVTLLVILAPWKKDSESKRDRKVSKRTSARVETTEEPTEESEEETSASHSEYVPTTEEMTSETTEETEATTEETTEMTTETTAETTETTTAAPTTEATTAPKKEPVPGAAYDLSGMVIVIDPGHQAHANSGTEPVAPWSDEQKAKVSAGTSGVSTGRPEYEVVLEIGLMLRDYLESMGATVIMTRTTNDVDISNIERANIAVENNADVFLRLHCDASDSSSARGIGVFVCSRGEYADSQEKWGNWLGNCLEESTGSHYRGCDASTRYSGLNWCTSVPSFLLEMGFMTNSEEDQLLSDPAYQQQICSGIAAFCYKMKSR